MRSLVCSCLCLLAACSTGTDVSDDTDTDVADTDTDVADTDTDVADTDIDASTTCEGAPRPNGDASWIVAAQLDPSAAPTPAYGTIVDGTYELTAIAHYGGATSSDGSKAVLVLEGGVTRFVLSRDRDGDSFPYCDEGRVETDGTVFQLITGTSNVFSNNYGYTASGGVLTLFWHPGSSEQVNTTTYSRMD